MSWCNGVNNQLAICNKVNNLALGIYYVLDGRTKIEIE